jgi:diguanylate cyclase (GGDEF)-like protein
MIAVMAALPAAVPRALLALAAALAAGQAPAPAAAGPPMTVTDFRRLSVEDPRACLERGDQLVAGAYAAAHPEWTREVLFRMARAATLVSDTTRVEQIATRLEVLGREKADVVATAYAALARAAVWADAGRVEDAIVGATKAATALDATGDHVLQAVAAGEVCDVAARAGRTELALVHCQEARARWAALDDRFQLGRAENYLSMIAHEGGHNRDAIRLGEEARTDFLRADMPALASMMDDNLAGMYLDEGEAAKALRLSQGSLAHELATGKLQHAALSRKNIARALSALGRHDEALASVAQAIAEAKQTDYEVALIDLYDTQLKVAKAAGRPDVAVAAAQASVEVTTKLSSQAAERAIAEMETRYRALEKQHEVDRLAQENRVRELELATAEASLRRQQLQLALVAVAGVSLAIVAVLLVLLLRAGRRRERELSVLSRTDALTGTASRRAFLQTLESVFAAAREQGADAALWVIDADHFKRVNDEHGHQVGDLVLRELVARVRAHVRASDTLGRLGGEEFGLVLPGATASDAGERAEAVRAAIAAAPVLAGDGAISVAVSIGVAMLDPGRHASVEAWLAAADAALYAAKRAGRNRVELAG